MFTTVQEDLPTKCLSWERCGWESFSKLCRETQPSQVKTPQLKTFFISFGTVCTYIPMFYYLHTLFQSNTLLHTHKLQVPATFTVRPSQKKATEHLLISPRLNPISYFCHRQISLQQFGLRRLLWGNSDGRCVTPDAILWGFLKVSTRSQCRQGGHSLAGTW